MIPLSFCIAVSSEMSINCISQKHLREYPSMTIATITGMVPHILNGQGVYLGSGVW